MRKVWMLAISGPCAVNNPPEYLLKATMRPVVRFSAVGQVNVHPLLVGGLASIWCRVRGTLGYSCLPGCLPMAFSLDTGMVTTMVTRKTAFFRVAYLALTHPQTKPH